MKSFYSTFIALFTVVGSSFAQTSNSPYEYIPKYDPPKSPNASSFERYTAVPGNYQTGQISPSIPLMSFTVDNLTVPLTLSYSNTGLKVSDVASWVGLGWNLNAGGTITREVKGIPDDGPFGLMDPFYANNLDRLVRGQMTGKERFDYLTQKVSKQLVDTEHDIFTYNVLGISGSFYVNKLGQCIQLPNSNNKIQFTKDQNQRLATFTITDVSGNNYYFNLKEESTILENANNISGNVDYYYNSLKGTSWYLTKILTKNNQEIDFSYNEYQYNQTEKTESQTTGSVSGGGNTCDVPATTPAIEQSFITTLVDVEQLSRITWKDGIINFTPGANRTDLQQINAAAYSGSSTTATVPCLGSISMSQNIAPNYAAIIQNVSFDYAQSPRLFLKRANFNTTSGGADHAYQFSYNAVDYTNPSSYNWPSYDTGQTSYNARDYWGYYNGALNNFGLIPYDAISAYPTIYHSAVISDGPPYYPNVTGVNLTAYKGRNNRVPNSDYASYGLLQQIVYPTGGRTVFAYEGNIVQKKMVPTATPESYTLVNTLTQGLDAQSDTLVTLGGTRIKEMDFYSDPTSPIPALTTHLFYDQNSFSCGFVPFFYTYVERIIGNVSAYGSQVGVTPGCYACSNAYIYTLNSSGTVSDPAPLVQYHNVTEYNGGTNAAGQILHSYTPANEGAELYYQSPYPTPFIFNWHSKETQTANQRPDGSNITLKSSSFGDNEKQLYTDTARLNHYDYDFKVSLFRNDGCTDAPGGLHYTTSVEPNADSDADTIVTGIYSWANVEITSENYVPGRTQETTFNTNGLQVQNTSDYMYNLSQKNLLLPNGTATIDSKGDSVKTLITYPQDYFSGTPANTSDPVVNGEVNLISHNLLAMPVEEINTVIKGGAVYVTSASLFTFYPDKLSFSKILNLSISSPVLLSSFTKSYINSAGTFVYDNRYQPLRQFYAYNAANQPLEFSDKINGVHHSLLWDYNSSYQVAEVVNASQADIAYTSFEADGTGNWTISSTARNTSGFSGTHSFPLSSTNTLTKTGLTSSQTYIVSYWTTGTSPLTITGTQVNYPVKGATVNGWTYYEHMVTGQSTITLNSAANINIDEVRLYPKDAHMTTWTYNPLIGINSTVNEKSQISYYEYDNLLRLINIKDKDGNIVKHTDYHYQGQ
jgi:hypothetical protein